MRKKKGEYHCSISLSPLNVDDIWMSIEHWWNDKRERTILAENPISRTVPPLFSYHAADQRVCGISLICVPSRWRLTNTIFCWRLCHGSLIKSETFLINLKLGHTSKISLYGTSSSKLLTKNNKVLFKLLCLLVNLSHFTVSELISVL